MILRMYGPGDVRFDEYEERDLQPDEVRLKTLYSGISAGTELTHYRGTNPYRIRKWNGQSRLFEDTENSDYYPRGTGYEEVGEVIETGADVTAIKKGEIVFGAWTHKSTHIMDERAAAANKLFSELEPIQGIFAEIGAIALNGILDARINVGETVAIFGQGVPGLICTQLAKLSGARVIAVDLYQERLGRAARLGADIVLNASGKSVAKEIKDITGGLGADICLEVSGQTPALNEAIKCCAASGRVVAMGFYQGEGKGLFLGEEFHHNRVQVISSQIGGIHPELAHRWNKPRLHRTIMELQRENKLRLQEMISHKVDFAAAQDMYARLNEHPEEVLQAVLCF